MSISLLDKENTGLIIVDVQEKLMKVMGNRERVIDRIVKLLHLSRVFKLPVVLTEQYSKWLGSTLPPIKETLPEYDPIEKLHSGVPAFLRIWKMMVSVEVIMAPASFISDSPIFQLSSVLESTA